MTNTLRFKDYSGGRFVPGYENYGNACKQLAMKHNIPCIDLNSIMVSHYNSVGYDTVKNYHVPDGTHFSEDGANVVAGLVAKAVKDQSIAGLSAYVK